MFIEGGGRLRSAGFIYVELCFTLLHCLEYTTQERLTMGSMDTPPVPPKFGYMVVATQIYRLPADQMVIGAMGSDCAAN